MQSYNTVLFDTAYEFTEKKSKFIGYVSPVKTEKEAVEFINFIRKKHSDATHNVYAYVVRENNISRFSDDGEPSGTAGMPCLDAIRKKNLCDVVVVVTRYFGGTLLGTGGLCHAYGKAASEGLREAKPVRMEHSKDFMAVCDYSTYGKITYILKSLGIGFNEPSYDTNVSFTFSVPFDEAERIIKDLVEKTAAQVEFEEMGISFMPVSLEG